MQMGSRSSRGQRCSPSVHHTLGGGQEGGQGGGAEEGGQGERGDWRQRGSPLVVVGESVACSDKQLLSHGCNVGAGTHELH